MGRWHGTATPVRAASCRRSIAARVERGGRLLAERLAGDEEGHRAAIAYALARQTPLGLLPEQVTQDGEPAWVVPLGWSHAMFVLAARPELALVRDAA